VHAITLGMHELPNLEHCHVRSFPSGHLIVLSMVITSTVCVCLTQSQRQPLTYVNSQSFSSLLLWVVAACFLTMYSRKQRFLVYLPSEMNLLSRVIE
jgi:hypothetical protein